MHNGGAPDGKYDGYEEVARIYERKYGTEGDLGVINRTWEDINFKHKTIIKLKDYLMNGIWRWYFTNE